MGSQNTFFFGSMSSVKAKVWFNTGLRHPSTMLNMVAGTQ